mgnify:CR=1 FL=1
MRQLPVIHESEIPREPGRRSQVPARGDKPPWLKVRATLGPNYQRLKDLMRDLRLHTVCEEAHCPNIFECWEHGTATFMILGDICTRACGFCAVKSGRPTELDRAEPERVADAVARMGLRHAVVTSVTRDDLHDGGAEIFAETIRAIRRTCPQTSVEVLIPDFRGNWDALATVMAARPDVLNHNVETVPRLYPRVRPGAIYARSVELLRRAAELAPGVLVKSGIMVGLGETRSEILQLMRDLKDAGCAIMTIGQYLRPSARHLPVVRYYAPEEFAELKRLGEEEVGLPHVEAGPLVRSSYHAHDQVLRLGGMSVGGR